VIFTPPFADKARRSGTASNLGARQMTNEINCSEISSSREFFPWTLAFILTVEIAAVIYFGLVR
jgi:hypothetical protein